MGLDGKVAIVTGSGSGFGEGIATRFAAEGARVVVNDVRAAGAERVAGEIVAAGGSAVVSVADVSVDAHMNALVDTALSAFDTVDIMVSNAGVAQRMGPLLDTDEAAFDRIFAINVKSLYLAARHVLPIFRERGGGVFLNTASTAAIRPRPGLAWYNASKGAVVTLTKSMAVELAPEGIRVNALCPVAGETGMLAEFMGGEDTPEMRRRFIETIPLGRLSTPGDVAGAAVFLCSDEAGFITGVCLEVDGGRCI
ncbi:MAG: glucose 1-dehydrogenase [Alphaproteobacteria bacterium]